MISFTAVLGMVACLVALLLVAGVIGMVTLVKAGIIVRHATRPGLQDRGDYTLDQGHEVRPESEMRERRD